MQKLHISEHVPATTELQQLHDQGEQLAREICLLNEKIGGIGMTSKHLRAACLEGWQAELKEKTDAYYRTKEEFMEKAKTVKAPLDRRM